MNPQQPTTYPLPTSKGKNRTLLEIVLGILLLASIGFGVWTYMGKSDLQKNTDTKIAAAVATAKTAQAASLQADFDAQNKSPNKTFTGSATYGSVSLNYPKTWSAYDGNNGSSQPINAYFHPNIVPAVQSGAAYALRVELIDTPYADVITSMQSSVTTGAVSAIAYTPPKLKGVANVQVGTKFDGQISTDIKTSGSMVVMKVRDKTLKVYTLSPDYLADFNNTVLSSLTFAP